MPEVWPTTLPTRFEADSYTESIIDPRLRSSMDRGPAKMRRLTSSFRRKMNGEFILDTVQLGTLQTFIFTTTLGGTLVFTFPNQTGSGTYLVRFYENLPTWTNVVPDLWSVKFELEILG